MRKQERQKWIAKIIKENSVSKQEELVSLLIANSIPVTQATISRDIKEMKLIKVPGDNQTYRYSLPTSENSEETRLEKLLQKSFISCSQMDKMISVVTKPGSGVALGGLMETVYQEELFTVMSNDDKILLFARTEELAKKLEAQINKNVK